MSTYNESNKRYYEKNKEKWREYGKKYRSTRGGQLKAMYYSARRRAELKGLEFSIELEDVLSCPSLCPVLGIEIKFNEPRNSPNSPSIDRYDNTKGYTKDNIRMISLRANTLKSDSSLEEIEKIYNYMKKSLN